MTTSAKTRKPARKAVSAAERERRAEARKEQAAELHSSLEAQVDALASSDAWKSYLDFAQSFHSYSFSNTMLILFQHPTATAVAGYKQWQERGRQVRKGEKAIRIFGYSQKKIVEKDEKTGEETVKRITFYPVLSVFAEDQTDPITEETIGDIRKGNPKARLFSEVPEHPARLLEGEDAAQIAQRVINHITATGWDFAFEEIPGSSNGYTTLDGSKRIVVDVSLSPAAAAKTVAHELAHRELHTDPATGKNAEDAPQDRAVRELEAEATAYVVAGVLGLDTSDYSIGYICGWSGGDGKAVAATAERVLKAAHRILEEVFPVNGEDNSE